MNQQGREIKRILKECGIYGACFQTLYPNAKKDLVKHIQEGDYQKVYHVLMTSQNSYRYWAKCSEFIVCPQRVTDEDLLLVLGYYSALYILYTKSLEDKQYWLGMETCRYEVSHFAETLSKAKHPFAEYFNELSKKLAQC